MDPSTFSSGPTAWSAWEVLASLGDSLAVVDTAYRIVWAKEPLLPPDPSGRGDSWVGEHCYRVFNGLDQVCEHNCPVREVLASGRPQAVERSTLLKDGRTIWREARAYPIRDAKGRIRLVARISFDITPRKNRQARQGQRRAALYRSLEETNRLGLGDLPFQAALRRPLTPRELEVLRLAARGLTNPQIAEVLRLSPHTVKRHLDNIFQKLTLNDRAQAAVWAAHQGLV
ncbi:MAG: helix-turn-helix transcriptional regulator [Desulfarculus sp.]|nr:helix-turn-helix transcriptional regulator [Desulfarculus sp.]